MTMQVLDAAMSPMAAANDAPAARSQLGIRAFSSS
jgi:hypothetical protein